jgi:hypothetical protein
MMDHLKVALRTEVRSAPKAGPQHLFVGPFNELSPEVVIYWVEERLFLEVATPADETVGGWGEVLRSARETRLGTSLGLAPWVMDDPVVREREKAFWQDRWLANCVGDGTLVEVEAKP